MQIDKPAIVTGAVLVGLILAYYGLTEAVPDKPEPPSPCAHLADSGTIDGLNAYVDCVGESIDADMAALFPNYRARKACFANAGTLTDGRAAVAAVKRCDELYPEYGP